MPSLKTPLLYLATIFLGLCAVGCVPPGGAGTSEENDADFRAGMSRKQAGSYVRAIECFERALQRNPRSAAANFELGLIYYQNVTNYVAAIYHFDRVQRLHPNFSRIDVVRQLVKVCKQELVRDAMGGFTVQMERELERLERVSQENAALRQEVAQLQRQLSQRELMDPRPRGAGAERGPAPIESVPERTEPYASRDEERGPLAVGATYTIQAGDTLYSIARRKGLSEAVLRAANPGLVPTRLSVGQSIRIPVR